MIKTYSKLCELEEFNERLKYLFLNSNVGEATFGNLRFLNQEFYNSPEWLSVRDLVIIRDDGCDLGLDGFQIQGRIYVHHINPITCYDLKNKSSLLLNPENLICTSFNTHNAIHYSNEHVDLSNYRPVERLPNDTSPWLIY